MVERVSNIKKKCRHLFWLVPYQNHTSILIALTFNCHDYKIKIDYFLRIESDYLLRKKNTRVKFRENMADLDEQ